MQQRVLQFLTLFLLGIILLGCSVLSSSSGNNSGNNSQAPTIEFSQANLTGMRMIDAQNGWAWGTGVIFRTNDSGATWINLTPKFLGKDVSINASFINSDFACLVSNETEGKNTNVFYTVDQGKNWSVTEIPQYNSHSEVFFTDIQVGWLLLFGDIGAGNNPADIFSTQDGGKTWVKVSSTNDEKGIPVTGLKNGISFKDRFTGWVAGEPRINGDIFLYKTTDGGKSWFTQTFKVPVEFQKSLIVTDAPSFITNNEGYMPVNFVGEKEVCGVIYITNNGGETWEMTTPIKTTLTDTSVRTQSRVSFYPTTSKIIWTYDGISLYITKNSAKTWDLVKSTIPSGVTKFVFANDQVGLSFGQVVYRTTDGGLHWSKIQ